MEFASRFYKAIEPGLRALSPVQGEQMPPITISLGVSEAQKATQRTRLETARDTYDSLAGTGFASGATKALSKEISKAQGLGVYPIDQQPNVYSGTVK